MQYVAVIHTHGGNRVHFVSFSTGPKADHYAIGRGHAAQRGGVLQRVVEAKPPVSPAVAR